jgi:sec-independent protein translocase protein TatA
MGTTELILILVIVLVIFGASRLPQLGEGLGKAIKGFKKGISDTNSEDPGKKENKS